jgi:uncharacterized RDD family membrane protein YckC
VTTQAGDAQRAVEHQGRYAGAITRLLAYIVDITLIALVFGAILALFTAAIDVATPWTIDLSKDSTPVLIAYISWGAIYFANGWVLRAKSPGMALFGLCIVRGDGSELDRRHALIRLVAFPLGFLTLGIGFLGIIFGRSRQAIYDRIADTAVIYDWDADAARIRALAKASPGPSEPTAPSAAPTAD